MKISKILTFAFLVSFFSCRTPPNSPSSSPYKASEAFIDKLNEQAGCCFRSVKINTYQREGWIVLRDQKGWYRAINLNDYNNNQENEWDFFQANQIKVVPSNSYHGSFTDIYGNIYEEGAIYPKDLEKQGHFIEKINIHHMANNLSENFGLSEKRSFEVSRFLYQMEKIRTKRAMENKDLERLSQNLLGIPFENLKKEFEKIENGQFDRIDDLIKKASIKNGLQPEDLKILFKNLLID